MSHKHYKEAFINFFPSSELSSVEFVSFVHLSMLLIDGFDVTYSSCMLHIKYPRFTKEVP